MLCFKVFLLLWTNTSVEPERTMVRLSIPEASRYWGLEKSFLSQSEKEQCRNSTGSFFVPELGTVSWSRGWQRQGPESPEGQDGSGEDRYPRRNKILSRLFKQYVGPTGNVLEKRGWVWLSKTPFGWELPPSIPAEAQQETGGQCPPAL